MHSLPRVIEGAAFGFSIRWFSDLCRASNYTASQGNKFTPPDYPLPRRTENLPLVSHVKARSPTRSLLYSPSLHKQLKYGHFEQLKVQSDARSRLSMLEKRRDDPKEIFDTLINVCPGLKGMNPLPSRGNAITNAADYIKYWSKYFDLSEEGLKDFQENSKNMNDFCEDMENVKMTEPCRQMKEIEKKHTQFAMFTQEHG
ncbi:Hypothetical predicted protein [Cloeon dipterum]|uniref:Uncharacterized protein n=1 Tax=Cloeon dipterum TaxID=197152 RepID=A0A8S1DQ81_9INSE|nr:Hypothetical predicted protein [Cloeon dipterum]